MSVPDSAARPLMIDLTMSLANRTAVYDIGEKLCELAHPDSVRYWRVRLDKPIAFGAGGSALSVAGKAMARGAFWETARQWTPAWPRTKGRVLFVDPIFCLKTRLDANDVVLCHDVAPVSHPEFYDPGAGDVYAAAYRRIQAARPNIIFVSEHTKRSFLELFPADYPLAEVIPLYFKPTLANGSASSPREKPFILMVGAMDRRKNFRAAIEAFARSGLADQGVELVMAGPRGNESAELLPVIGNVPGVMHLGYLGNDELAALYAHARALFFPSLLEGFGVPALEAPQANLLPIVSRGTVLEEVVGPDGVLVDPHSLDDMAQALRAVIAMPDDEKQRRLAAIRAHQSQFSMANFRARWRSILGVEAESA